MIYWFLAGIFEDVGFGALVEIVWFLSEWWWRRFGVDFGEFG